MAFSKSEHCSDFCEPTHPPLDLYIDEEKYSWPVANKLGQNPSNKVFVQLYDGIRRWAEFDRNCNPFLEHCPDLENGPEKWMIPNGAQQKNG